MRDYEKTITLAMTGASGAPYGLKLMECLIQAGCRVYFMISGAARIVVATETELELPNDEDLEDFLSDYFDADIGQIRVFTREDWFSPVASGSGAPTSMVICPASGGCISAIAHGASNNLIERAADVAIKERRQLIVVPRETPVSVIHLENQLKLAKLGVTVLPASPGFYQNPETVEDLVDFMVARILDQLGVAQGLLPRWGED
ncbi:MAG: UbiX family flavin prenyltransferase [Porticoccaceae bacterium]|nr:UbiX family flavin prenyltransferase [Porticoccaceae bacterium]